jgi:cytochrome c peroxidase
VCSNFFFLLTSCKKDPPLLKTLDDNNKVIALSVPSYFLYPDIPSDNQPTANRIKLGKMLFNDPVFSKDSTVSCNSCHQEDRYFTDNLSVSTGIYGRQGIRNAPSLLNVAYQPYMFWDGGNPTLEQQVLAPISNPNEMDFDVNEIVKKLNNNPVYVSLFQKSYSQNPNVYTLTRAIACYERTLIKGNSRYDKYLTVDTNALNTSEKNGMHIFFSEKGDCFHCHQGFMLTDFSFRNNGLYLHYADSGRSRITQLLSDIGKFKVPSLRNVEMTAPYMHDGSLATLEAVVDHYNSGGYNNPNKSPIIRALNLTNQEKQDLVNFLKTFTSQ